MSTTTPQRKFTGPRARLWMAAAWIFTGLSVFRPRPISSRPYGTGRLEIQPRTIRLVRDW